MKKFYRYALALIALPFAVASCADEAATRPAGPDSGSSAMPWNTPVPGQGQGQFGMLPQNQHRR